MPHTHDGKRSLRMRQPRAVPPAVRLLLTAALFASGGTLLKLCAFPALERAGLRAAIAALKSGRLGSLGIDVYEEESDLFFRDLSGHVLQDDVFARLTTFPNVVITGHQAFFTEEAVRAIAETTIANLEAFEATGAPLHRVGVERLA